MEELLRTHYSAIYGLAYFGAIAAVALAEGLAPKRRLNAPLRRRWSANIGVALIDVVLLRLLLPFSAVAVALACAEGGIGVLPWLGVPGWLGFLIAIPLLDFTKYLQHYLLHRVPWLWRLHRMHHTDQDYDFTTGLRFHPVEAVLTIAVKLGVIAVLGAPVLAVLLTELAVVVLAMVSHGNVRVPPRADALLRPIVVTPDMHRVHHSTVSSEHDSNFGILLPWWDRILGTYTAQPAAGHLGMRIGLTGYEGAEHLGLSRMLADPFVRARAAAAGPRDEGVDTTQALP